MLKINTFERGIKIANQFGLDKQTRILDIWKQPFRAILELAPVIMVNQLERLIMNYKDIITIEPGKRGGKPCIRGMRMTVYDVLDYLASGMTHKEILDDFPYLTEEDILACLSYAADRERSMMVVEK